MAQESSPGKLSRSLTKGMITDLSDALAAEGSWSYARNAVNASHDGSLGMLGNEPATLKLASLPLPVIGCIHLGDDEWCLFLTDDVESEIGLFDESRASYRRVIRDKGLAFSRSHLITGASRRRSDCGRAVYWTDGKNPDRFMDLDNPPYVMRRRKQDQCWIEESTGVLDTEALRMSTHLLLPTLTLQQSTSSGSLPNGMYLVAVAYSDNGQRLSNFVLSNAQGIFNHQGSGGSLELNLAGADVDFDEIEVVLISHSAGIAQARRLGYFSSRLSTIFVDTLDPTLPAVPLEEIPLRTPAYESSDAIFTVSNYLLKVGIREKFQFNYQPLANKIRSRWVAVRYKSDYYHRGGNKTGYLRDEQYAFFIRWIHNTGEKTASYHIPGRAAKPGETDVIYGGDAYEAAQGQGTPRWKVENTATLTSLETQELGDGGQVVASGEMGYWESAYQYPDDQPLVWGELCGKPIRHHKFPDGSLHPLVSHFTPGGDSITILGVEFDGIAVPVDNAGKPIDSIVGYEILRGSREGHKSIVAKGVLQNMREYAVPGSSQKGLYQNFPYNDLRPDYYHVATDNLLKNGSENNYDNPLTGYSKTLFSFHSPDTSFSTPYLGPGEFCISQELSGSVKGSFEKVYKHPRAKILSNTAAGIAYALSLGIAVTTALGKGGISFGGTASNPTKVDIAGGKINLPAVGGALGIGTTAVNTGVMVAGAIIDVAMIIGFNYVIRDQVVRMLNNLATLEDYALQYQSHCFYDQTGPRTTGERRRQVVEAAYHRETVQTFGGYRVNNLYRTPFVLLEMNQPLSNPAVEDTSRVLISDRETPRKVGQEFSTTRSSVLYGAYKIPRAAQYGQLESIRQLPIGGDYQGVSPASGRRYRSPILFGGDTYIGRFTEKNAMFFFNNWLQGQPDEYEYDYRLGINIPYPRFWLDSNQEGHEDLKLELEFQSPINFKKLGFVFNKKKADKEDAERNPLIQFPIKKPIVKMGVKKRSLNRIGNNGFITIRNAFFYLFSGGVRDFFVESEINLAQRDWEDAPGRRHYDPYRFQDISELFRSDLIQQLPIYKYDQSLSIAKLPLSLVNWGQVLPADYDPRVAETCQVYYPNRAMYSLPQNTEQKRDNWRVFLPLNYRDFRSRVTAIRPMGRTGALMFFEQESPLEFVGVDTLQTAGGTKLLIGDGGLFENQPLQNVVNADRSYQYGSCSGRYSICASPQGVFWVSPEQGKIFQYAGGLQEISRENMKFWLARYLPFALLRDFPGFTLTDNPVHGIGIQTVYENTHELLYFCKRDYALREEYRGRITYRGGRQFLLDKTFQVELGDELYFEDASWTLSYDPKIKGFISFHDWHPDWVLPGRTHPLSIKDRGVWLHNSRTDLFCSYYDQEYPFEVELIFPGGQQVFTLRGAEYLLECYRYSAQGRYHELDENFDGVVIHNSEQISPPLRLVPTPKNNPLALVQYPLREATGWAVLAHKEENKYRFNQFWDAVRERGEFVPAELRDTRPLLLTDASGYRRRINPATVDLDKPLTQRKKFRHYVHRLWLRRNRPGSLKMLAGAVNTTVQPSAR